MENTVQKSEGQHQEIINEIAIHEKRILALLDDPSKYKNIDPNASGRIKFLDTDDYTEAMRPELEKTSMKDGKVDEGLFRQKLQTIEGKRTADGSIVVHTQKWEHGQWIPKTDKELEEMGDHEKTHGMAKPEIVKPERQWPVRKTGCKTVMFDDESGTNLKTEGHHTYESQTQILTLIGAHPEAKSFEEIANLNNQEYNSPLNLRALCTMLDLTFPDYDGGTRFLADQYFSANSDFVQNILSNTSAFYSVEIPAELSKKIVEDSNSQKHSEHSVDFSLQVSNLKKILVPPDPIQELKEATKEMIGKKEPSSEDIEAIRKLTDQLRRGLN